MAGLTGMHLIAILAVVVLLFGAPKLPGLARSVGQSLRIFKGEVKTLQSDDADVVATDIAEPVAAATKVKP